MEKKRQELRQSLAHKRKKGCEKCGAKNHYWAGDYRVVRRILTVHHIDGNIENNEDTNLQTLCRKCHDEVHNM